MEKKYYIEPSLKALELDEELLAAVSDPIIDEDDESEDLGRKNFWVAEPGATKLHSVWDEEEE